MMGMETLLLMTLFIVKHFVCDFPLQTINHVQGKGQYGNLSGINHSAIHALGTALIFVYVGSEFALLYASIDFFAHYHIDWVKMNINRIYNLTPSSPDFWNALGADQALHYMTYIFLICLYGVVR